jgi:hypothetical protein
MSNGFSDIFPWTKGFPANGFGLRKGFDVSNQGRGPPTGPIPWGPGARARSPINGGPRGLNWLLGPPELGPSIKIINWVQK